MKNSLVVAHLRRAFSFTSALAAGLLLVACASNAPAPVYTAGGQATAASALPEDSYVVKPGEYDLIPVIAGNEHVGLIDAEQAHQSPLRYNPADFGEHRPAQSTRDFPAYDVVASTGKDVNHGALGEET